MSYPRFCEPETLKINTQMLLAPSDGSTPVALEKGPNIKPLPLFDPLPESISGLVMLKVGDDISTDEIMPAGAQVLPYRSNIPEISKFTFNRVDERFYERAAAHGKHDFFVIAGDNYGQGSSREHASIAPRYLGLRVVIAKSFARIHWQNLVNFGILPLVFADPSDYDRILPDDQLHIPELRALLFSGKPLTVYNQARKSRFETQHTLSARQIEMILEGSLINVIRKRQGNAK
jgi:aconitate hydratase